MGRMGAGVAADRHPKRRAAFSGSAESRGTVGVAQTHTAASAMDIPPRAPRDRLALGLRHQRHDPANQVAPSSISTAANLTPLSLSLSYAA